ncbi:MAG: thioredoxin domain-containing protein [Chloroflexota bacterium]
MSVMKWSVRATLIPFTVTILIAVLAACGPATGSTDESPSDSVSSEEILSILGNGNSAGEDDLPAPVARADEQEQDEDPTPSDDATQQVEDSDGNFPWDADSLENDEMGLPVGFTADGHPFRGDPGAPIVIEEYSDYQCPYCSRFYEQTLPSLLDDQMASGEAVLIYYDFPLSNIHPQAAAAANAARCAGEQGAADYWAMHDTLFSNPDEWSNANAPTVFAGYAADLELDVEQFDVCMAEDRYADQVQEDFAAGQRLGVSGTPSFFINGQLLVGAQPLANFVSAIETVQNGGQLAGNEPQQQAPAAVPTPAAFAEQFAGAMGDPQAPVTIVEFTDYQCPYCSQHSLQTLPAIVSEFVETGRVYYILKDLPLDQLHPDARVAAEAARCAGDQDAYWQMHDELFANQPQWAGQGEAAAELFVEYAADLGLDESEMTACLESGRFKDSVEANVAEARSLGVTGTPMFFIDGYPLNGARPIEHFQLAVQYAEEGTLADAYAPAEPRQQEPSAPPSPAEVEIGDAFVYGDPDAPITIVEFTDFQCPYCVRHFQQTYPRIVEEYVESGIVQYVFKDFPLNSIHPQAAEAAQAARCAGEQEAFLEMHDTLFQRQVQWSGQNPADVFVGFADELGLDAADFEECLISGKYEEAVNADLSQGIQLGVTGTPAFFINGYAVSGAQPYELFQQAIESILAEQEG